MRVLVTGGAGFIGSRLCLELSKDHEVHVIDNLNPQIHGEDPESDSYGYKLIKDAVNLIVGDVSDQDSWDRLSVKDFDVIYFLASETGTGQSMYESQGYFRSNVMSLALLNDLVTQGKIKCNKIVLSSSRSVYGDGPVSEGDVPVPSKESDRCNPLSIYAATKLAQENILNNGFSSASKCILRFQNVYGPGQSLKNPYTGILSIFTSAMMVGEDVNIFNDGMMSRDFVYIDDVVRSLMLSLDIEEEVLNVGSGQSTTVLHVANRLKEITGSSSKIIVTGEKLIGDIRHNVACLELISKYGYKPTVFFDEGVERFVEWAHSEGPINNGYRESLGSLRKNGILVAKGICNA